MFCLQMKAKNVQSHSGRVRCRATFVPLPNQARLLSVRMRGRRGSNVARVPVPNPSRGQIRPALMWSFSDREDYRMNSFQGCTGD